MIKLYVHPGSTPALSVMFASQALGLEAEMVTVDLMNGGNKTPEYLAVTPIGKVPALSDGDFNLFESGAILRYLARKAKSDLYPVEYKARALVDQWLDYVTNHVRSPYSRVMFNRLFAPMFGQTPDEASIQVGLNFLSTSLPHVESALTKRKYIASDTISLADIALLATLDPCEVLEIDLSPYPALTAWRSHMKTLPFYTKIHSHYGAEMGM